MNRLEYTMIVIVSFMLIIGLIDVAQHKHVEQLYKAYNSQQADIAQLNYQIDVLTKEIIDERRK